MRIRLRTGRRGISERRKSAVCLAGAAVMAALIALALAGAGNSGRAALLFEKDGVAVYRGAEEGGTQHFFSRAELLAGGLELVSPAHPLPEDYPIPNTRAIRAVAGQEYIPCDADSALTQETIYALCALRQDEDLNGMRIGRATVSPAQQTAWRTDAFYRCLKVMEVSQALESARNTVPAAGESEHQLGTAFDITLTGQLEMGKKDALLQSAPGKHLAEILWRYGFIRRYPPDKTTEGGCEGLHLRYVGQPHAAVMRAGNLSLEEYLSLLTREKTLTVRWGEDTYYLYRVSAAQDGSLTLFLPDGEAGASLDNLGGAVVWVRAADSEAK